MKDAYGRCIPEVPGQLADGEFYDPDAVVSSGEVVSGVLKLHVNDGREVKIPLPPGQGGQHTDLGGNPI